MDSLKIFLLMLSPALIFFFRGAIFDIISRIFGNHSKYWKSKRVDWAIGLAFTAMAVGSVLAVEVKNLPIDVIIIVIILTMSLAAILAASSIQEEWARNRQR